MAVLPGAPFCRPRGELSARLAYVDFNGDEALAASETIPLDQPLPSGWLESHCGRVLEGARRLAEWASR